MDMELVVPVYRKSGGARRSDESLKDEGDTSKVFFLVWRRHWCSISALVKKSHHIMHRGHIILVGSPPQGSGAVANGAVTLCPMPYPYLVL
jgi:hypothetical protein